MHIQDLAKAYEAKTDDELLHLAGESEQLTPEARVALKGELAKRRIDGAKFFSLQRESEQDGIEQLKARDRLVLGHSSGVGELVAHVHRIYRDQFWLYVKLTAPAVAISWIVMFIARYEIREIGRNIPIGVEMLAHQADFLKIWLLDSAGYFVSWMTLAFSFGAICVATGRIAAGVVPSAPNAFAKVRQRAGPFLRLCLLLYFLLLVAIAAASLVIEGILWVLREFQVHRSGFTIQILAIASFGLVLLIFSRFLLAVPALVLDNCRVIQAIFRSDELTEGKWLTLAALLTHGLFGGYVAGMCPFWLASRLPANIALPVSFPWVLTVASIAGVTVFEPPLFIGFVALYLQQSSSDSSNGLARQSV